MVLKIRTMGLVYISPESKLLAELNIWSFWMYWLVDSHQLQLDSYFMITLPFVDIKGGSWLFILNFTSLRNPWDGGGGQGGGDK